MPAHAKGDEQGPRSMKSSKRVVCRLIGIMSLWDLLLQRYEYASEKQKKNAFFFLFPSERTFEIYLKGTKKSEK